MALHNVFISKSTAIICYGEPFPEMKGNVKPINPFNFEKFIAKMGMEEFMTKYLAGELYLSN